ncbi:hypothetical protein LV85_00711 [Algoriphagus chordae]|uniref:Uncharacterized protein n=2 Tax=Algoriphagus chordae TaxID=237019 RepID=A0A2W7R7G7_9BACT|nr:hypothetical protein LV85_00711 [Algoriphagus chordae]
MDSAQLGELLDPQYTYQDMPLPLFVEKLEGIFSLFRSQGESQLEVLTGYCDNLSCNPRLDRRTYRFYSKVTRDYLDLRFSLEPSDDGLGELIAEIYQCYCFNCLEDNNGWYGDSMVLTSHLDERTDFSDKPDVMLHLQLAGAAVKESAHWPQRISKEFLEAWLMKYEPTYDFIEVSSGGFDFETMSWDDFYMLFYSLKSHLDLVTHFARDFDDDFLNNSECSEMQIIEKLLRFDKYLNEHEFTYLTLRRSDDVSVQIHTHSYWIEGEEFDFFAEFHDWFNIMYGLYVHRYYALTEAETDEYLEFEEDYDPEYNLGSLKFHMDIRKRARENGEYIPLRDF